MEKVKDNYRYGFNGQEKVNEIAGVGNWNTAEFWEYGTREAHRKNPDPVRNPSISPYAVFDGNPVLLSDVDGDVPGDGCCDGLVDKLKEFGTATANNLVAVGGAAAAALDNVLPTTSNPVRNFLAPGDPQLRLHYDRGTQAGDVASMVIGTSLISGGNAMMTGGTAVTVGTGGLGAEVGVPAMATGAAASSLGVWMLAKAASNSAKSAGQQQGGE